MHCRQTSATQWKRSHKRDADESSGGLKMRSAVWLYSVVLFSLLSPLCGQNDASVTESLIRALEADARLELLRDAFVEGETAVASNLHAFPVTVIAPTDAAFQAAIEQKRLICRNRIPCSTIEEYFNPSLLETNLLRHVFPWSLDPDSIDFELHIHSVNGFPLRVEHDAISGILLGGAPRVAMNSEILFSFGKVIIVGDILTDRLAVNSTVVAMAERIVDVGPFRETERQILAETISDTIDFFRKIHAQDLKKDLNSLPLMFLPSTSSLQSFSSPSNSIQIHKQQERRNNRFRSAFAQSNLEWKIPRNVQRPSNSEDFAFMSVLELASLLRQGKTTSTELTRLFLSRMKRLDPYLELVITYTEELAWEEAQRADREMALGIDRGPLHGIPYGLKDIISVPGYPTTWGSEYLRNQTFDDAAWVYKQLSEAGAVLIAKLATGAFALGDIWFGGRTKNPWNIKESSCGSSSGSGAATSAGLVPFAIGTETWGSISCPASRMGITAIRPTYGFVGRSGTMTLAWSLDKIGPFCRFAMDCALVMDSLRGADPNDTSSVVAPFAIPESIELSQLRIGYTSYTNTRVIEEFKQMGVQLVYHEIESELPAREMLHVILEAEASANFEDQFLRQDGDEPDSITPVLPQLLQGGQFIPAAKYIRANQVRRLLMDESEKLFSEVDAMLVPSTANGNQGTFGNLIGIPEVIFPIGHEDIRGEENSTRKRPKTQALIGRPFSDGRLLALVAAYQNVTSHHLKRPPVHHVEQSALDFCLPYSRACSLRVIPAALCMCLDDPRRFVGHSWLNKTSVVVRFPRGHICAMFI